MCELAAILRQLYEKQLHLRPEDEYLRRHVRPQFLAGSIRVFEFYSRHLPPAGRVLDWGCRHAPDACLIRARRPDLAIEACGLFDADHYPVFHRYADLSYRKLDHIYRLPYPDAAFDAIIASGAGARTHGLRIAQRATSRAPARWPVDYHVPTQQDLGGRMVAPSQVPRLPPAPVQQIRAAAPSTSHRVPAANRRLPNPIGSPA